MFPERKAIALAHCKVNFDSERKIISCNKCILLRWHAKASVRAIQVGHAKKNFKEHVRQNWQQTFAHQNMLKNLL